MISDQLTSLLRTAVQDAVAAGDLSLGAAELDLDNLAIGIETPKSKQFGDFACNLALTLQKPAGLPGREVASRIVRHIPSTQHLIERVEIAGPGFMNLFLK